MLVPRRHHLAYKHVKNAGSFDFGAESRDLI